MLDTNQEIVKQNEFKKIYRAKHPKLAKAPPISTFFVIEIYLGVLCALCASVLSGLPFIPGFQNLFG